DQRFFTHGLSPFECRHKLTTKWRNGKGGFSISFAYELISAHAPVGSRNDAIRETEVDRRGTRATGRWKLDASGRGDRLLSGAGQPARPRRYPRPQRPA